MTFVPSMENLVIHNPFSEIRHGLRDMLDSSMKIYQK